MDKINQLVDGHVIVGKLGRDVNKSEPEWIYEGNIELFVMKDGDKVILLVPKIFDWAEYTEEHYHEQFNCFENEGYYMEVTNWDL